MVSRDEQTDILGGPILQRPDSGVFATFSRYQLVFKVVTLLGLGLLVWIACARGVQHLKKNRELRYRKAMRRKHGIPDSDRRPFAVAYAAAKRVHLEREAQIRKKKANYVSDHNPPAVDQRTNVPKDACLLRKRVPETTIQLHDYHFSGTHATVHDNNRSEVLSLDLPNRYNPSFRPRPGVLEPLSFEGPAVRCASRKESVVNFNDHEESKKRSFEDESDVEHEALKKSRIDELMDGDEQADWYAQYSSRPSRRESSESLDQPPESSRAHVNAPNHADDLHNEDYEADEAMEGVDEDEEVTRLKAVARGKKRDRTEAGSTFGGDDEEDIRNGRAPRRRKRQTMLQMIEVPTRGRKRDREVESPESAGDAVHSKPSGIHPHRSSKKKRGRKGESDEVSEMPEEDVHVSKDPLCGGRGIGEGWEVDGVQYKVGDKGERLRLTLVKKARNKYHMPQDSQHPDRSASLEIYVEMWMTEEQYRKAEVGQELAWQEAPRESSGSKTPDVLDSPTKSGKSLLWDSVKHSPARRSFRQFIPPGASTPVNPFEQSQSQPLLGRRVASSSTIFSPILPGVTGSPTCPGFRGFSKWEKQDREAEAMARIRGKIEERKKVQASSQKSAETPVNVAALEPGPKPLSVPTITLTPAPAAEGKLDDGTPQSKSNPLAFSFAISPSASDSSNSAPSASSTTPIFLSSSVSPTGSPSILFPGAPTASTATASTATLSPFSLVKPPQATSPTPSTAVPSALPNIFGKGTGVGTPSSPIQGTTIQPPPPSTSESAARPISFSFAPPNVSSSPTQVVVPPATKFQPPISNVASCPSPSSVTSGFAPAGSKAETLVPTPSASATTSEGSKPMTPLFSFSGASSSTGTLPTSSAPKFSFGQLSTTSSLPLGSNPTVGITSQPKPTSKFGQIPSSAISGASASPAADEPKKSTAPLFGAALGSNEATAKPSPFGATSMFGTSTYKSPTTDLFAKPVAVDSASSTATAPKPSFPTPSTAASDSTISTPPRGPTSGDAPVFSFGGSNSPSKAADGTKTASLFGGEAGSNDVAVYDGLGKPTVTFGTSTDGSKPTSSSGGNIGSLKAHSVFSSSTEGPKPSLAFGGAAEGSQFAFSAAGNRTTSGFAAESANPMSLFATASDNSKPSDVPGPSKASPASASTTFSAFTPASPFTFGKKDAASANVSSMDSQTKPVSFDFGASLGATTPIFGQPFALATNGDSRPSVFGKPTNTTPGPLGFGGAGGLSSPTTFTFGKPAAQNQKQEQ